MPDASCCLAVLASLLNSPACDRCQCPEGAPSPCHLPPVPLRSPCSDGGKEIAKQLAALNRTLKVNKAAPAWRRCVAWVLLWHQTQATPESEVRAVQNAGCSRLRTRPCLLLSCLVTLLRCLPSASLHPPAASWPT